MPGAGGQIPAEEYGGGPVHRLLGGGHPADQNGPVGQEHGEDGGQDKGDGQNGVEYDGKAEDQDLVDVEKGQGDGGIGQPAVVFLAGDQQQGQQQAHGGAAAPQNGEVVQKGFGDDAAGGPLRGKNGLRHRVQSVAAVDAEGPEKVQKEQEHHPVARLAVQAAEGAEQEPADEIVEVPHVEQLLKEQVPQGEHRHTDHHRENGGHGAAEVDVVARGIGAVAAVHSQIQKKKEAGGQDGADHGGKDPDGPEAGQGQRAARPAEGGDEAGAGGDHGRHPQGEVLTGQAVGVKIADGQDQVEGQKICGGPHDEAQQG